MEVGVETNITFENLNNMSCQKMNSTIIIIKFNFKHLLFEMLRKALSSFSYLGNYDCPKAFKTL